MEEPSLSAQNLGTPNPTSLETVDERLAKGANSFDRNGNGISPEKRKSIEEHVRKGRPLGWIAEETSSSRNTVAIIRDQLIEREPDLFKTHMAQTLKRVANKAVGTIEKGIDALADAEVKPGMLTGLSVTAGILLDKLSNLSGEQQIQVVEHRLKIDAGTVSSLIKARQEAQDDQIIEAEVVSVEDRSTT